MVNEQIFDLEKTYIGTKVRIVRLGNGLCNLEQFGVENRFYSIWIYSSFCLGSIDPSFRKL